MSRKGSPAKERRRARDLSSNCARRQLIRIYRRDQGICQLCGDPCTEGDASREHKIPLRNGGGNDDSNIVLAHKTCNLLADEAARAEELRNYTSQSERYDDTREEP